MEGRWVPLTQRPSFQPRGATVDEPLTFDELTSDEVRVLVWACEIDNADRAFEPLPEDLQTCERLRERGLLRRTMIDAGSVAYDLSATARTADRLSRLTETAQASVN